MPRPVVPSRRCFAGVVLSLVQALVVRHDQVRGGAHAQAAGVDLAGAELVQLGQEHAGMDCHARPNDAHCARIEDAGRDQVDGEAALLVDDRVASVGATVAADNQVRVSGEQVDDLAFALVTPMAADDSRYRHVPNFSAKESWGRVACL